MEQKCPKSIGACLILTRIILLLIVATAVAAPWLVEFYEAYKSYEPHYVGRYIELLVLVYLSAAVIFMAMISLDRMLKNVSMGNVFVKGNIKRLKIIAYCIFAESFFCLIFGIIRPIFIVVSIAALFFGVVVLAFKDLFVKAMALREENDFTI